ncbi:hypothetical protein EJ08DRAFT_646742 [Tothia fuscella]|uniref:Uncharacterized protein n=1 Tax=Tothia fuscella TaxID=1048955 RepID=A0A9P4NXP1_9PEZI|nr:hypothetical protein EJ08DRAFT_646742 [Tothia fuscella]
MSPTFNLGKSTKPSSTTVQKEPSVRGIVKSVRKLQKDKKAERAGPGFFRGKYLDHLIAYQNQFVSSTSINSEDDTISISVPEEEPILHQKCKEKGWQKMCEAGFCLEPTSVDPWIEADRLQIDAVREAIRDLKIAEKNSEGPHDDDEDTTPLRLAVEEAKIRLNEAEKWYSAYNEGKCLVKYPQL